ncbi:MULTISPECIES: flagellar export chaperone FlgN [Tritonibacter]|uniref:Flagellar export chaperone FlgN n=1 Tax=Tritonibacter scottomollicae TaxID=483013 RepID=A0A2T1AL92_TRISK|nr:flagellar export chaperone FlgN [Tritonibacter scottomollicae]PRZ49333.1 FlgN protein [Tritonibacter scottomollicae]WOI32542.1 flagellar export chaperone FlgN [Tritonibacter scottomollicae]
MSALTDQTPQTLINALDELLEEERSALTQGELDKLEGILARKEELFDKLNRITDLEQGALDTVHSKVTRNQALLGSAMQGIKAVATRMAELRKVRRGLEVYNRSGQRTSYTTSGSMKLEKRA